MQSISTIGENPCQPGAVHTWPIPLKKVAQYFLVMAPSRGG